MKHTKKKSKLARLMASSKRSKERRVSEALKKFLRTHNPARSFANIEGHKIKRLKGGALSIIPIKRRTSR